MESEDDVFLLVRLLLGGVFGLLVYLFILGISDVSCWRKLKKCSGR